MVIKLKVILSSIKNLKKNMDWTVSLAFASVTNVKIIRMPYVTKLDETVNLIDKHFYNVFYTLKK